MHNATVNLKVFSCDDASMLEGIFNAWVKEEEALGYDVLVHNSNLTAVYGHGKLVYTIIFQRIKAPENKPKKKK